MLSRSILNSWNGLLLITKDICLFVLIGISLMSGQLTNRPTNCTGHAFHKLFYATGAVTIS